MPSSKKTQSDDKKPALPAGRPEPVIPVSRPAKEHEPAQSSDEILKEIQEREKVASREAEEKVQEALGKEARLREPEIEIPPDVKDAGVVSPEGEASELLQKGSTIDLPITEEEYREGKHTKVTAKVTQKKEVFGVSSIIALVIIVGRMIKMAHHNVKKVVFSSSSAKAPKDEKGD